MASTCVHSVFSKVFLLIILFFPEKIHAHNQQILLNSEGSSKSFQSCKVPNNLISTSYSLTSTCFDQNHCILEPEQTVPGNGTLVRLKCQDTYMLRNDIIDFIVCFDGVWYPREHSCQKACRGVNFKRNTEVTCTYDGRPVACEDSIRIGTKLEWKCKPGYQSDLKSQPNYCLKNGSWQFRIPECTAGEYVFAMGGDNLYGEGTYQCKKQRDQNTTSNTTLFVTGLSSADASIFQIRLPVGFSELFQCDVTVARSLLPITVRWFKFGDQMHTGDRISIKDLECESKMDCGVNVSCKGLEECRSQLMINNINLSDSGDYRCVADSAKGYSDEYCVRVLTYVRQPASARIEMTQTTFPRGKQIKIPCKVNGVPPPMIIWYLEDNIIAPVPGDNRFALEDDGHFLIIRNPENSDSGFYKCDAINGDGRSESGIFITIL